MKLSILEVGLVPRALATQFDSYPDMVETMFGASSADFSFETIEVARGAALPDISQVGGIIIPGAAAGVYDDIEWMEPLRDFIRRAYKAHIPILGICFGHQIIADALGGDVGKSGKGWGLGRHVYDVKNRPNFMADAPQTLAVTCSHQDQVLTAPASAEVILSSDFTPNAGLFYGEGPVVSFQPHPEFEDEYLTALAELRRGRVPDAVVEASLSSLDIPSQQGEMARYITAFFKNAAKDAKRR